MAFAGKKGGRSEAYWMKEREAKERSCRIFVVRTDTISPLNRDL